MYREGRGGWRAGREDSMAFRAVPRPGSKIPTATGKWEVGPLYRLSHSARAQLASGGAGPGGGGKSSDERSLSLAFHSLSPMEVAALALLAAC